MRNKLMLYAVLASIIIHLVALGVVGKSASAKPISIEDVKIVSLDLPSTTLAPVEDTPKPELPKPRITQPTHNHPHIAATSGMMAAVKPPALHKPINIKSANPSVRSLTETPRSGSTAQTPGDPGGALQGITAPNGQDLGRVATGRTPVGWVPGGDRGGGIGRPDPVPNAEPGPGVKPAQRVDPPPPPAPKFVSVTVCSASGMLPGPHCSARQSKSFREGSVPTRTCNVCKPPEPKHTSTLADRSEPELIKDAQVKLPNLDESGDFAVKIRYTVNTDGSVSDIEVTSSSGVSAIDRAVRDAATKMRYKPAVQNGEPRSVKIRRTYKIRF